MSRGYSFAAEERHKATMRRKKNRLKEQKEPEKSKNWMRSSNSYILRITKDSVGLGHKVRSVRTVRLRVRKQKVLRGKPYYEQGIKEPKLAKWKPIIWDETFKVPKKTDEILKRLYSKYERRYRKDMDAKTWTEEWDSAVQEVAESPIFDEVQAGLKSEQDLDAFVEELFKQRARDMKEYRKRVIYGTKYRATRNEPIGF